MDALGRFAGRLHRGQQQRDQDGDDRDHHQQLDQGEPRSDGARIVQTWAQTFPPGRARGFDFDPPARGPLQTVCERPARMLVAEASEQKLDGQVFWLSARGGPRTAFPPRGSGMNCPGAWPITAAAPRRILTVFPILPLLAFRPGAPVEQ